MKDYKTVAEDVFRRSDEVIEEKKMRRKKLAEIGISAACWAAVGAVGFGVWKTQIDGKTGDHLVSTVPNAPSDSVHSDSDDEALSYIFDKWEHRKDSQKSPSDSIYPDEIDEILSHQYNNSGISESEAVNNEYMVDGVDIRCIVPIHLPFIGVDDDPGDVYDNVYGKIKGRISNIDVDFEEAEYSPENGEVIIANSLKKAIEIYGAEDSHGELIYHVIIEYYKDGELIETTKDLWQSEHDRGARLNFESSSSDWGAISEHHIWSLMTVNELESFEPSEEYGYVLHLHNAYLGHPYELKDNIINGLYNNGVYIE